VAQEFFEKHLPEELLSLIDFATLSPQKDSFITDKLRQQVADLLFSVNFNGDPGYIYLLTEHTSKPDKFLPYRMHQYVISIMDRHLKKHSPKKKLPLVVPLILYTGDRPYTYSTDLFDLFGEERELAKSLFLSPYQLIDLNKTPNETLRENYYLFAMAALVAKHIRNFDLVSLTEIMIDLLKRLKAEGLDDYIYLTIFYIIHAGDVQDEERFREIIQSGLSEDEEEKVMTLREKWLQEGRAEGEAKVMTLREKWLQEGRAEGEAKVMTLREKWLQEAEAKADVKLRNTALNFLKLGVNIEKVVQATALPLQEVQDLWEKAQKTMH
jgi:predicted transposase/invertase (TIGR01784 family)